MMEGDRLVNIEVESAASEKRKGSIYRGKVMAVEPSFEAAFVNYGVGKEGFLPFDEVCSRSLSDLTGHGKGRSRSGVRVGDTVLVQVTKEEVGKKGAALTMHVSLPGRYVVLMPFDDRTGVSRKLDQDERIRLRKVLRRLGLPEGFGVIIRTSGEATDRPEDLQLDLDHLVRTWETVLGDYRSAKTPGEIHADSGLAVRFIRDYLSSDVSDVLVEDEYSMRELERYMESCMPGRRTILKRYNDEIPLFMRYGIERQVEALLRRKVLLPSGGSIVVGETEALVAIDVNSGRLKRRGIEDTAFQTNLEAAREIARQVVLRDLGGIIVVDFIDMENDAHRQRVVEEMKAAMAKDKARLTFGRIAEFGLLAFSRQRIRQTVDSGVNLACPTCSGSGRIRSPSALAMSALRRVRERLATQSKPGAFVEVVVPVRVANFLNNRKRAALVGLEKHHGVLVDVTGDADAQPDEIRVDVLPEVPPDRTAMIHSEEETAEETPAPPPPPPSEEMDQEPKERSGFKSFLKMVLGIADAPEQTPAAPAPSAASRPPAARPADTRPAAPARPAAPVSRPRPSPARQAPARKPASSRPAVQRAAPQRATTPRPGPKDPVEEDKKPAPSRSSRRRGSRGRGRRKPAATQAQQESTQAQKPAPEERPVADKAPPAGNGSTTRPSGQEPGPDKKPASGSRSRRRPRRKPADATAAPKPAGVEKPTAAEPKRRAPSRSSGRKSPPKPPAAKAGDKGAEEKKSTTAKRSRRSRPSRPPAPRGNDAGPKKPD